MRIALVGKGGSGKTTLSSLLFQFAAWQNKPVLGIDADINQHMADAIGWETSTLPEVGNHLNQLKNLLLGESTLIPSPREMMKTTLPAQGSHLITLHKEDAALKKFAQRHENAWFLCIGGMTSEDLGQRCFHAKTGGAELILNHLIDQPNETVLVDMTAGADAFASGLFTRFDLTLIVVEPTLKSINVYKQYKEYAKDFSIAIKAIGNKIENAEDVAFLKQHCGDDFLGYLTQSTWVKQRDRGIQRPINTLEPENLKLLKSILNLGNNQPRNWQAYWETGIYFHILNAKSWGNDAAGCDVTQLIDTEFLKNFRPQAFFNDAEHKVA